MDQELEEGQQRREDLRLTAPDSPDWEAIVEVKGYTRSDGKTADLIKIHRFVTFYVSEKGKLPSKIIYLVNGPIEINPGQRGTVMGSAGDDIKEFTASNGLVIGTTTLYKTLNSTDPAEIRRSIIEGTGRWEGDGE